MNYQGALAALMIFGSMSVYAETTAEKPALEKAKESSDKIIEKQAKKAVDDKEKTDGTKKSTKKSSSKKEIDPETRALEKKKKKLMLKNTLRVEVLKNENAELLANLQKIKWEKEVISEQLAVEELKYERDNLEETTAYEEKLVKLMRESSLSKEKVAKISSDYDAKRIAWDLKTSRLTAEIATLKAEKKRDSYVNSKPVYLENPLKDDNTLVISDRRIALNGPILEKTADYITTRINYYNNKDSEKPVFIVINTSPGGSVMAGYRILKAMEGSKAPVYVVLKSFAASMAAAMVTLAKKSFAYPNAIVLHHQISTTFFFTNLNLTQQKEYYTETEKWWARLAAPIAKKMGISTKEFIKQMYSKSSDGDWSEFASDAKKLKWVDHIVDRIEETSLLQDPNLEKKKKKILRPVIVEALDKQGRPIVYLPRLSPKDKYFLYNPDRYYRLR